MDLLLALLLTLLAAAMALVVIAFLPTRFGSVPVPLSVLVAAAALIALPRACFRLTGSVAVALAPAVVWFVVTAWTALHRNPLYPQQPLAVGDWRLVVLMLAGGTCGALTVGGLWASRIGGRDAHAVDARRAEGERPRRLASHSAGADSGSAPPAVDTDRADRASPAPTGAGSPLVAGSGRGEHAETDEPGGETP